jgi:TetR/AcrR family transcriptional regulator of autoinduction and epiphytic fitness
LGLENYRRSVSETKRAAILKAGRENFLKNGYSRAAVAEIAREADVSTATLYKHFASKEELFAAVIAQTYDTIGGEFTEFGEGDDVPDMMFQMVRSYLTAQFDQQANALLRVVIAEVPSAPKVAQDTYEFVVLKRSAAIKKVFDRLIERKMMKPHDTELGVHLIAGMVKEVFVWPAMFDPDFAIPDNADAIIREAVSVYLAQYGI